MMPCLRPSKIMMVETDKSSRIGSMKINQACRVSGHDFRTEIIKKSKGAVHQVVMTSDNCSDDKLLTKLRSCFSDAPTMNQAWEELRNLRQKENESITVYAYQWGYALVRSSGIHPENETHPTSSRISFCHYKETSGTKS